MRYGLGFFATIAALLAISAAPPISAGMPGGYASTPLTDELTALLFKSLKNEKVYGDDLELRVCVLEITSVEQQVVAGMNYRFTTSACDVIKTLELEHKNAKPTASQISKQLGQCAASFAKNCVETAATITVYQSFDDSVQVSDIKVTTEKERTPAAVHAAEM